MLKLIPTIDVFVAIFVYIYKNYFNFVIHEYK